MIYIQYNNRFQEYASILFQMHLIITIKFTIEEKNIYGTIYLKIYKFQWQYIYIFLTISTIPELIKMFYYMVMGAVCSLGRMNYGCL